MKTKIDRVLILTNAVNAANLKALEFQNNEDGGSCNFDSVVIKLEGWTRADIQKLTTLKIIGDKLSGRYWKGYRWLNTTIYGQGNKRTKMAETACNHLKECEYNVSMYYEMD
jgi:hypothetical protein